MADSILLGYQPHPALLQHLKRSPCDGNYIVRWSNMATCIDRPFMRVMQFRVELRGGGTVAAND